VLNNDTVTVTGMVMMPPYKSANPDSGVLMYVGNGSAGFYLQDTAETDWSGVLVLIQNAASYPAFGLLDSGTVVKVTGKVFEYATNTQKTTEIILTDFTGSEVIDFKPRPQPVEITLDSLKVMGTDENKAISEKWEGVYVIIRNVSTFNRNSSGGFYLIDDNNLTLNVGTKSNYYYQKPAPADGSVLEYIRGYIETRSGGNGGITINPSFTNDVKIAQFPPSITEITRDPVVVSPGQQVTVTAKIKDRDGTVANAKLFYRKDLGINNEVVMTNLTDSTYQAVIPSQTDSCVVDYFIQAADNQGNISNTPSDTTKNRYFYIVMPRIIGEPMTIQEVQYSPFGSGYSAYNNYQVTVRGIVTADTSDIPTGPQVIIQNGTGPWSAIRINGTEVLNLHRGDDVTVTGMVTENFSVTNLTGVNSAVNLTVNSTGNTVPEAQALSTADINFTFGGIVSAEKWENVLVKYSDISVTDENADGEPGPSTSNFGEILVADSSNVNTRVELQDGNHQYHNFWEAGLEFVPTRVLVGHTMDELTGILYYSFSNYKLIPRKDDDFLNYSVDVDDDLNSVYDYKLSQNYPNPFNPSTKIDYSIKTEGLVTLKIYNILGQQVAVLVNAIQTPGNHSVSFDASRLASGIYLYKLDSNGFTQTKKMMLIR